MKPNILVITPLKPNLDPRLAESNRRILDNMLMACEGAVEYVRDNRGPGDTGTEGLDNRCARLAPLMDEILRASLKPEHTHVMWLSADIVTVPPELPLILFRRAPNAIIAPRVLGYQPLQMRHSSGMSVLLKAQCWYDTAGFEVNGKPLQSFPPHGFEGSVRPDGLCPMDSVGDVYLVPARRYDYSTIEHVPGHVYHYSTCKAARDAGVEVLLDTTISVTHAWLPDYGERTHTP